MNPTPSKPWFAFDNAILTAPAIRIQGPMPGSDVATYQIMDPEELGLTMTLPLGKHSGRHAFSRACESAGMHLTPTELAEAFRRFKELADTRKKVTLYDVFEEVAA